ncbi:peptidylprolyl isomerase [Phyllobacterium brassicacearum]|uniref:Peptidyl-prolyl cis-trans isomerase n=1 Tax=Phyllobacterium brassicacearum TaxID=314235 RepID=A0A2P7BSK9_9HYPH|nr:peptidylprolyl isomerase [Phyllobacterium brassicacearum]PSH69465.1 peptidylprolyl isomerase [Phyllobacterium brassicacearum]TDQ34348.1 cyclophilin family peptidyl-prolyl cis-trans isomerase [Phyllobacterium brassicacearum]
MSFFRTALVVAAVSSLSFATLNQGWADDANTMTIKLKDGDVKIELLPDLAPKHVEQIKALAKEGAYDNVVFHRVIPGFMAQTGDVQYGNTEKSYNPQAAGTGGSTRPDLPAEFSKEPFVRGVVGMARAQNPNSANSQFFIMFKEYPSLNGEYTVVGKVTSGMDVVDKIKKGSEADNGAVENPDKMIKVTVGK